MEEEKKRMSKKKKVALILLIPIIAIILILGISLGVSMAKGSKEGLEYKKVDGGYYVSYKYATYNAPTDPLEIEVPAEYNGEPVIGVADEGFYGGGARLVSVTLPDTVTYIGERAFLDCSYLVTINMGKGVKSIGAKAFSGCQKLTFFALPDTLESIGESAFQYCANIVSVTIPEKVTVIEAYTFAMCSRLEGAYMSDNVTKIGKMAFFHCSALKNIQYPQTAEVGEDAFKLS